MGGRGPAGVRYGSSSASFRANESPRTGAGTPVERVEVARMHLVESLSCPVPKQREHGAALRAGEGADAVAAQVEEARVEEAVGTGPESEPREPDR